MKVLIDGKEYDLTPDGDGLVSVTFTKQDKSPISIGALEDCAGTTVIDNIQLEQADKATAYEDPALIQGEATGLIKDIRGLEYAINDPVNGLRSQLTILAQGFEAEVADAIGNYSVQGQTIDGLFSEIKSIDGNLNQLVRNAEGNNQLISSLQNDVAQNRLDYHSLKETADSYERIIGSSQGEFENNVSRAVQTSGLIQQEVASLTSGLSTTVSQLEDSWAMQLKDENDVKTALNATTDGLRLKGDLIHLTGTTSVDGDFWAKEINSIQINADNIISGQIDASEIRVINLDADSMSGNFTEFVKSNWNAAVGGGVDISGLGVRSIDKSGSRVTMENGVISVGNHAGVNLGFFGGHLLNSQATGTMTMTASWGTEMAFISATSQDGKTYKRAMGIRAGAYQIDMFAPLDMDYNTISKVRDIGFDGGHIKSRTNENAGYMTYDAITGHSFAVAGADRMSISSVVHMWSGIDMHGKDIANTGKLTYSSDERLKMNIKPTGIKALEAIMRWKLVEYDWIADGSHVDIGLLSQRTPEILTYDRESDTYGIDAGKQTMINTLAIQELNQKVDNRIFHVDSEIAEMKQEIKQLKEEVAYLKGA